MTGCGQSNKQTLAVDKPVAEVTDLVKEERAKAIGIDAYIYPYPLVKMKITRRVSTDIAAPEGSKAPWANSPSCPVFSGDR